MKPKIETVKSKWQGIAKRKKILVAVALALVLATAVVGGAQVYALAANGLNLSVNVEKETPLVAGIKDEYIRTDEYGNIQASSGNDSEYYQYYRMANIRIEGYANTGMKGFVLTTTDCEQIEILSVDNATISANRIAENEEGTVFRWVDTKEDGTLVSNLRDGEKGKVVVLFNNPITVKELQEFLRTQVVIKPLAGTTHTIQVTVLAQK